MENREWGILNCILRFNMSSFIYLLIYLFVVYLLMYLLYVSELGAIFCCHASEKLIHRHNQCQWLC